jgi:hypothetical protein
MPDVSQVTAGKPKIGGHVWRAPLGTTLPTTAVAALDNAFIDMGYISDEGVSNADSIENNQVKAWGGTVVLNSMTSRDQAYKAAFISAMNPEVQKMVYGNTNVSGTVTTGMTVTGNSKELEESSYVIDMIAKGNVAHRIVIPSAKPTAIEDIVYNDPDAVAYGVTLGCTADANGNTKYEYWQANE